MRNLIKARYKPKTKFLITNWVREEENNSLFSFLSAENGTTLDNHDDNDDDINILDVNDSSTLDNDNDSTNS